MDFSIYFCADGILRAKFTDGKPMIPVKFLQEQTKLSDLSFWVRWWEHSVFFEKGLTVGKFLLCLEPWQEFWGEITCKNVAAYIKEVKKPIVVKEKKEDQQDMDWISIFYFTEMEVKKEYAKSDDNDLLDRDINEWLNAPKMVRLSGEWEIHSSYKVSGYVKGKEEHYSIDYTPMNELANVPIILNNKHLVHINDWSIGHYFGDKEERIFKENALGLCKTEKENPVKFFVGEKYHRMREVVEGFFWWMYSNPVSRDDFVSYLKNSVDSIDHSEEEPEEIYENNVVPLFGSKEEKTEDVDSDLDSGEKKMKVKVADGAFSSIISEHERDKEYWDEMLALASKENNVVLKIGKIEEALPIEKRVYSYLINEESKTSNPQGTEFKLI